MWAVLVALVIPASQWSLSPIINMKIRLNCSNGCQVLRTRQRSSAQHNKTQCYLIYVLYVGERNYKRLFAIKYNKKQIIGCFSK